MSGSALADAAREEARSLHAFFVDWFRGTPGADIARLERALAADFRMVTPDGSGHDREAVAERVRRARGTAPDDFAIAILDPRPVWQAEKAVLLEFIEEQYRGGGTTRRLSTALFTPEESAPQGVVWRHLHETWMP